VAEAFGLGIDEAQKFPVLNAELQISPRDVVLITGDSGSGKSVLLRAIRADLGDEAIDMSEVHVDEDLPLIEGIGATVEQGLELLSMVGLNDAFLFLRTYRQLSDGQRFRYRLAKFLESNKQWLLVDEFAATLDRDTARIVAFNLQKLARRMGKAVIAATTHNDLFEDLSPSVHVRKRFGEEIAVQYYPNKTATGCSLLGEMQIEPGTLEDWRRLCVFHYRSHSYGAKRKVFNIRRNGELCGVIVYCYPFPQCFGRNKVLPKMSLQELNQKVSVISRIVVHPKYRSIGLGEKLVRDSLPLVGTECVELIAVMPRYNPFAERAGMRRVMVSAPCKEAVDVAAELERLDFDLRLLGSQRYVMSKLETLSIEQLTGLRAVFARNKHPMFREVVDAVKHNKGDKVKDYGAQLEGADFERLGRLIKVCGVLLQTKVYLFWQRDGTHKL
jgi:ABC-type ATPase with predicted acetyltransferase domain